MKKKLLSATFAFALLSSTNVLAQQGFGTNEPHKSAAVEIMSSKRGLLIPRISIPNLSQAAPVTAPATSLFVYNTNTTTGVGFYYWDGAKWVRFVSANTEKTVEVAPGENVKIDTVTVGNTTTYTVSAMGGTANGQVLVTKIDNTDPGNPVTTTEWVNPEDFVLDALQPGNAIGIAKDPVTGGIEVKFNGTLSENTTIATGAHELAITGLQDISTAFDATTHNIVVMDANGVLKITSPKSLVEDAIDEGNLAAKTLTGSGITVTAGTAAGDNTNVSLADVVLKDVTLGIADEAITNTKLAPRAVSQDKMTSYTTDDGTATPVAAGQVPVAQGDGTVAYQNVATAIGEDLITDGKIVIGNSASTVTTKADAVLVATELSIAQNSITSSDIKNGTIETVDIKAPGSSSDDHLDGTPNMVMVTNADGDVAWVNQSVLPSNTVMDNGTNTTVTGDGSTSDAFKVNVATANGTTLGVVREADTNQTVNVVNGVLSVNLTNTTLSGDVTGPLNATVVGSIQGTGVSDTAPTATNNVLVYDAVADEWVPTQLTGSHIDGKALTSTSIIVTPATNKALLEPLAIEITPGTADGQVLVTNVDNTDPLNPVVTTEWATVNSVVNVDNGLRKVTGDVIHLGGTLKEVTEIETSATNTLAIKNLQKAPETNANKAIVAEATSGVLRTIDKVLTGTNIDIAENDGYSFHTPEIVINVTLDDTDQTILFPLAASAPGQVINIKIANIDDDHDGYLNVLDTYGSMPYQGWVVKSNGTDWIIVARN